MTETKTTKNRKSARAASSALKNTSRKQSAVATTVAHFEQLNARNATAATVRHEFRIYPSIGIARVGNSSEFFVGPEVPGQIAEKNMRGADGGIKKQAARFRIYEIAIDENGNEDVIGEVVDGPNSKIAWNVSLANKKAAAYQIWGRANGTLTRSTSLRPRNESYERAPLVISSLAAATGANAAQTKLEGEIRFVKSGVEEFRMSRILLGSIATDDKGRLLVIGGSGVSGSKPGASLKSFADNDGWFDSVSDGPVSAKVDINGVEHEVASAWVVVTVPRFAPYCYGIVTWYDQAVAMARTNDDGTFTPPRTTSFTKDVFPILHRADLLSTTHFSVHAINTPAGLSSNERIERFRASRDERARVRQFLSPLSAVAPGPQELNQRDANTFFMPKLFSGSNPAATKPDDDLWVFLSLTRYQFAHIDRWVDGNYQDDWTGGENVPMEFDSISTKQQPARLIEAALESCVGGSFFPGIEGTYDIARHATYHSNSHLRQEFRIDPASAPGLLTEKMALPWQADFADCEENWWPSQRPVSVTKPDGNKDKWSRGIDAQNDETRHKNMVAYWMELGFVMRQSNGDFVEIDRHQINGIG